MQVGAAAACLVALIRAPAAFKRQANSVGLLSHAVLLGGRCSVPCIPLSQRLGALACTWAGQSMYGLRTSTLAPCLFHNLLYARKFSGSKWSVWHASTVLVCSVLGPSRMPGQDPHLRLWAHPTTHPSTTRLQAATRAGPSGTPVPALSAHQTAATWPLPSAGCCALSRSAAPAPACW